MVEGRSPEDPWISHPKRPLDPARVSHRLPLRGVLRERGLLVGDPQGVERVGTGLCTSVTASRMTDAYGETVARRRSAALLSEFGLGHVREYAPFDLILSALHLILRAKSQHI